MKEGKRLGKVFIDTNIINYAIGFRDADIFAWIKEIYETIYIHQSVLDELVINKHIAQKYIDQKDWLLFNPTDNLTPEELVVYSLYVDRVTTGFANLDKKRKKNADLLKIQLILARLIPLREHCICQLTLYVVMISILKKSLMMND